MSIRSLVVVAVAYLSISATSAEAQDQCRDVLRDGVYGYESYKDDSYFNQIVWSRFLKSTFQSSKTDRAGGFGVPVGEIVLGGNYSEAQYNAKKLQIQNEYFSQITSSREIDIALMSGDEDVLNAWSSCMDSRGGGLTVRFEPVSPVDVFMRVEYFNQGARNEDKLARSVVLPADVAIEDGASCLKKGNKLVNGKPCIVRLRLKSALTTIPVVVESKNSIATAWLPARIQLSREVKPYEFSKADRLYDWAHKRTTQHRRDIELTAKQIADGWLFEPPSARTGLHRISVNNSRNRCHGEWMNATGMAFSYGYTIYAGNRRRKDGHIECAMSPYILMRRDVWVPMMIGLDSSLADGVQAIQKLSASQVADGREVSGGVADDDAVAARESVFKVE